MRFDVAVIGLGGVGAAVAFHAARRGLAVVGLDAARPGHVEAASSAPWRGFRAAYSRDDRYVHLAKTSLRLWRELEELAGLKLFEETGALLVAPAVHPALAGMEACGRKHGLPIERWSADELSERTPMRVPTGFEAILEGEAGLLRADACNGAHLRGASDAGAVLHAPSTLRSAARDGQAWRLTTDQGEVHARLIVVAAGGGSASVVAALLPRARLPIVLERHPEQWFMPSDARFEQLPPWNVIPGTGPRSFHGHPHVPARGTMIARHRDGERVSWPPDRTPRPDDEREIRAFAAEFLPTLGDAPLATQRVHVYCNLPDDDFLVGPMAGEPSVLLATGLCGHGYKFASAIGLGVAEMCTGQAPTMGLSAFDPRRFDV